MMGHNKISADGFLGAQSGACTMSLLRVTSQSLWCRKQTGCFDLRKAVFLDVRKGSFLAAR